MVPQSQRILRAARLRSPGGDVRADRADEAEIGQRYQRVRLAPARPGRPGDRLRYPRGPRRFRVRHLGQGVVITRSRRGPAPALAKGQLGERFTAGIVLHLGTPSTSFGDGIHALSLSALWGHTTL